MLPALFPSLNYGHAAYEPKTAWGPWSAVALSVVIFVIATVVGLVACELLAFGFGTLSISDAVSMSALDGSTQGALVRYNMTMTIVMQGALVGLTVVAAGFLRRDFMDVLALRVPRQGWGVIVPAFLLLFGVVAVFSGLAYLFWPSQVIADLKPFSQMLRTDSWWLVALAVVVGAPLSEELLFRGFLLSALARSRLGFVGGVLVSNLMWTVLHAQYSLVGLVEVFIIGLAQSWLLWRTGSLWVLIVCHAIYNALVLAVLLAFPL